MKKTISTACLLMVMTALTTACGSKSSKNLTTTQLVKRQTGESHTLFHPMETELTRCCLRTSSPQQTYRKVLDRKASSITIKDYMK